MTSTQTALKVVSRAEWLAARKTLLHREKEFTRQRDALSAERRRLPMVKVEKDYIFEGIDGRVRLRDLFGPHRQYRGRYRAPRRTRHGVRRDFACARIEDRTLQTAHGLARTVALVVG